MPLKPRKKLNPIGPGGVVWLPPGQALKALIRDGSKLIRQIAKEANVDAMRLRRFVRSHGSLTAEELDQLGRYFNLVLLAGTPEGREVTKAERERGTTPEELEEWNNL